MWLGPRVRFSGGWRRWKVNGQRGMQSYGSWELANGENVWKSLANLFLLALDALTWNHRRFRSYRKNLAKLHKTTIPLEFIYTDQCQPPFFLGGGNFWTCPPVVAANDNVGMMFYCLPCTYSIYLGWVYMRNFIQFKSRRSFLVSSTRRIYKNRKFMRNFNQFSLSLPPEEHLLRSHGTSRRSFVSWMLAELRAKC